MTHTKDKGDLAELKVMLDMVEHGWKVAIPYGENWAFDLLAARADYWFKDGATRVQCKYTESDGSVIACKASSTTVRAGNVRKETRYTSHDIDILAVYDKTTDACYYIDSPILGDGRSMLHLRLIPSKNNQTKGVRWAKDHRSDVYWPSRNVTPI